MTKPTTRIRGIRSPIPTGHILGRTDDAHGDAHPIKVTGGLKATNRKMSVALLGDVSVNAQGRATVTGLQGVPVDSTAPTDTYVLTYVDADGQWEAQPATGGGTGDVSGPGSSTNNHVAFFDGTTGKLIKDSGLALSGSNTGDQTISDATISTTDITTNNVTSTKHGFAPKSPADATKFLNGDTTPAYAQVKDSDLSTTDITTNNVSTSKHGFTPKLPNDATKYLDGTGAYSVPAGGGGGGTPANPTATASDTAVNGVASTYMRSDAAPAVQKASASLFGLVKPDGTTIQVSGGAISANTWTHPDIAPPLASWFTTSLNSPTFTDYTKYGLGLTGASGGTRIIGGVKAGLVADTTIICRVIPGIQGNNTSAGIVIRDSSGGKCVTYGIEVSSTLIKLSGVTWTSTTVVGANVASFPLTMPYSAPIWLKIVYTASSKQVAGFWSFDGKVWQASSMTANTFVTAPDSFGPYVWSTTSGIGGVPSAVFTYWTDGTNDGAPLVLLCQ